MWAVELRKLGPSDGIAEASITGTVADPRLKLNMSGKSSQSPKGFCKMLMRKCLDINMKGLYRPEYIIMYHHETYNHGSGCPSPRSVVKTEKTSQDSGMVCLLEVIANMLFQGIAWFHSPSMSLLLFVFLHFLYQHALPVPAELAFSKEKKHNCIAEFNFCVLFKQHCVDKWVF